MTGGWGGVSYFLIDWRVFTDAELVTKMDNSVPPIEPALVGVAVGTGVAVGVTAANVVQYWVSRLQACSASSIAAAESCSWLWRGFLG